MSAELLPSAMLNTQRTACMRLSPWTMKCSAVVIVSSALMTARWTASELLSVAALLTSSTT